MTDRPLSERDADRRDGFYWVRVHPDSRWIVAEWYRRTKSWWLIDSDVDWKSEELAEIDERRMREPDGD